ncbi:hypothetical protein QQM39_33390 [Streptomyces sp. DT2A-34]|uniref:hypothetical protein n=1 Tax=Streptomyces sp. DT2A-34 TaxID=3051182 RepID=UPI00265BDBD8|nr:hypothetical protein [Streptomyces sp. DT2A-34]MDO0915537.1 hypothetical protein [Streptomyces sp. DT2A-34]
MTSPQPQPEPQLQPQQAQPQQPAPTGAAPQTEPEHHEEKRTGGKVVHLHTAHPRVPIPYVTPGDLFTNARKATSAATATAASTATSLLPTPRRLAFYGILGGMAAAGAMAWPVAVAVGAATEVITREQAARHQQDHARMERARAEAEQDRQSAAGPTETGTPPQAAMG